MPASWQAPDLDEIRFDFFVINNEKVKPLLRGEGDRDGRYFHLQTHRRDGWIARVRMAGFSVRTLQDRVNGLASITYDIESGAEGLFQLGTARERVAGWDTARLRWSELPVLHIEGERAVRLRVNEPLRRRRSRGAGDYFIAVPSSPGRIGLQPVSERHAIVQAYSLLASSGPVPLRARATPAGLLVSSDQALLPEPHREALNRLAQDDAEPWTFIEEHLGLAEQVFKNLGLSISSAAPSGTVQGIGTSTDGG